MNNSKYSLSIFSIGYPLLLALLLFLKSNTLYSRMHLASFPPAFAMASAAILLLFCAAVSLISHKGARVAVTVLYFVISIILAVDGVHYTYVSKLPSFTQLGMVSQLDDIIDTIVGLIKV